MRKFVVKFDILDMMHGPFKHLRCSTAFENLTIRPIA